jgi:glycosyltransferase involved in cell wall biosynthesis
MVKAPLLTVGIPCYNEEKFLTETLNSILNQTFSDFVVYVCDDCSTDNSLEIANSFAFKDERIKVLSSDVRTNFVKNWNRSLEMCNTKYFSWIGAHDILHEKYFEDSVKFLEANSNVVLIYPTSVSIDVDGKIGESTDSDLVTLGLKQKEAFLKLANNLNYCTAIHGVFKSVALKKMPIKRILGFDFLILFLTPLYGNIAKTEAVRFFRRMVREETHEEAVRRWDKAGMFEKTKYDHFQVLIVNCLINFLYGNYSTIPRRLRIAYKIAETLGAKFSVSKKQLLKCLLKF